MTRRFSTRWIPAVALGAVLLSLTVNSAVWLERAMSALLISTVLSARAPAAGAPRPVDPAVVKAAEEFRNAVLSGDAGRVAAMFLEDGIELPNCAPAAQGRAAIERRYREFFASPMKVTAFTLARVEAVFSGDIGYDVGAYEQTLSLPGGRTTTDKGKYVAIVRRAQNGWKLAHLIYNSDTMPAAPVSQ